MRCGNPLSRPAERAAAQGGLDMIEMLSCKKCNHRGRIIRYGHFNEPNKTTYRISCPNCSYSTKEKNTKQEALFAWNFRGGRKQ